MRGGERGAPLPAVAVVKAVSCVTREGDSGSFGSAVGFHLLLNARLQLRVQGALSVSGPS